MSWGHSACGSLHRLVAIGAWAERNTRYGAQIAGELEHRGVVAELAASNRVAEWAYAQTEAAKGLTWVRSDEMVPLDDSWRAHFA